MLGGIVSLPGSLGGIIMIIGKTTAQKNAERNARIQAGPRKHKRVFLFFPRKLEDGRWAWLGFVTRYIQTVKGKRGWIDRKVYSTKELP